MRRLAVGVLTALALYLPLEDFILKFLPLPGTALLVARQVPDLIVAGLAVLVFTAALSQRGRLRGLGGGADVWLAAFLALAVVSMLVNGASLFTPTVNLKALLRYVLVAYVLVQVGVSRDEVRTLFRALMAGVALQAVVAGMEALGGETVKMWFIPAASRAEIGGVGLTVTSLKESLKGYVFGTMSQTIDFAFFLLVGLVAWLVNEAGRSMLYWLGAVVLLVLLYLSGSRSAFLAGLLVIVLHQYAIGRVRRTVVVGLLLAPVVAAAVVFLGARLASSYVLQSFTGAYVQMAYAQRLGILFFVLPHFLTTGARTILVGLTADRLILTRFIHGMSTIPSLLLSNVGDIEDVYWVALLVYYGVLGLAAFVGFLATTFRRVREVHAAAPERWVRMLALVAMLCLVLTLPLNVFNQAFEVRQFSYFLWLVVGLALASAPETSDAPAGVGEPDAAEAE